MRVMQTFSGQPKYYDRNPKPVLKSYRATGVAPHGLTGRWEYTVPAGLRAYVEFIGMSVYRNTPATTAGECYAELMCWPGMGGGDALCAVRICTNTYKDGKSLVIPRWGLLRAGDKIYLRTADFSEGGTHGFCCTMKAFEFT